MDPRKAVGWAKGHRNVLIVAAFILVFAGGDLLINRPKDPDVVWFSIPFLAVGFGVLALIFWPTTPSTRLTKGTPDLSIAGIVGRNASKRAAIGCLGGITTASPSRTISPRWLTQVVFSLAMFLSGNNSTTSALAVIVSPIRTALLNFNS
jgi:hypothetical protein